MMAKALDEVRFTLESSPVVACRQKLKSIIVCTPIKQGMSNIQGNVLTSEKAILPPPDGAENIIDIWDCDPNPPNAWEFFFSWASLVKCLSYGSHI